MNRKLAAILAADVVGYSSLMAADETGTLDLLKAYRGQVFDPAVERHRGRIVKLMGDGTLVEFASVVDAVLCAIDIQNRGGSAPGDLRLRVGIHVGDVIIDADDLYGDGVNIAARLEPLAAAGGICISGMVFESLGNRVDAHFEDAGDQRLKNLERPVRVYHWSPGGRHASASRPTPRIEKPSIAVLAFDNMSHDPDQEYFSDGIAEDIITALSHFREFFVIARNTSFTYKGKAIRVDRVCRDLGVRYLLEGSVRKAGTRVRVTAQLIDGETGVHLWAAKYDRDLDDIFAVQDEISQAIIAAVAPETLDAELKRSRAKKPDNLSTWDMVLRARWQLSRFSRNDNEAARQLLVDAVAATPDLSDAWSSLAYTDLQAMLHLWRRGTAEAIALAGEAARRATTLDENHAGAHAVLGMAEMFGHSHDDAMRHLEQAIRLNPNLANAFGVLATVHGVSGEYDAAKAAADRAVSLSPRDPARAFWLGGLGIGAYLAGAYDECLGICRRVLKEHPGYASSMRQEAASLGMLGRIDEAAGSVARLLERMPGLTVSQVRAIVPIRYPADQERWLEGLRRAGLPE